MALDDADPAVYAFQSLGVINLLTTDFVETSFLAPIESFLCKVYAPKNSNITTIPNLMWELYRLKNFEEEKLPPTLTTFFLHNESQLRIKTKQILSTTTMSSKSSVTGSLWMEMEPKMIRICYSLLRSTYVC